MMDEHPPQFLGDPLGGNNDDLGRNARSAYILVKDHRKRPHKDTAARQHAETLTGRRDQPRVGVGLQLSQLGAKHRAKGSPVT